MRKGRLLVAISLFVCPSLWADTPHFEFAPAVAFYTGDALRMTTLGSASLIVKPDLYFWLGIDFMGGELKVDDNNGLGLHTDSKFIAADLALYINLPALLGADTSASAINAWPADLYTSIGLGPLWLDKKETFFGFIGGGLSLHTPPKWLAVRFDLKNMMYLLEDANGTDFNSDLTIGIGPSVLF